MPTGVEFSASILTSCVGCNTSREVATGRTILEGDRSFIVDADVVCECGERRVRIVVKFQAHGGK